MSVYSFPKSAAVTTFTIHVYLDSTYNSSLEGAAELKFTSFSVLLNTHTLTPSHPHTLSPSHPHRPGLQRFLLSLHQENGSFVMHEDGEEDIRWEGGREGRGGEGSYSFA